MRIVIWKGTLTFKTFRSDILNPCQIIWSVSNNFHSELKYCLGRKCTTTQRMTSSAVLILLLIQETGQSVYILAHYRHHQSKYVTGYKNLSHHQQFYVKLLNSLDNEK